MAEDGFKVSLNVYDLSQGLARQLSTTFLGKAIEGIWHTGVVVYDTEYYFGGGIQSAPVGTTPYGTPIRVVDLGVTHVPKDVFEMYLQEIGPRYTADTYSLMTHNCNNFSSEVTQFLVGASIPDYILNLPNEVMSSPMGPLILPMIQQLESTLRAGAVPQAPQFAVNSGHQTNGVVKTKDGPQFAVNSSHQTNGVVKTKEGPQLAVNSSHLTNGAVKTKDDDKKPPEDEGSKKKSVVKDPLGDARSKVQEEISREFAAIMATGTSRASEAAALATRRVMQRHGHMNGSTSAQT
ncbi:hypothetical protein ACS0TY_011963 [Phlomoides rotata]